jgi:hypothetical protein
MRSDSKRGVVAARTSCCGSLADGSRWRSALHLGEEQGSRPAVGRVLRLCSRGYPRRGRCAARATSAGAGCASAPPDGR